MNRRFGYYFKLVALAHVLIVIVFLLASGWRRFFRPESHVMLPIEFRVEVPAQKEVIEPPPAPAPEPEPVREPELPPKPGPRRRKPIQRSTTRITRQSDDRPPGKTLTEKEIRKLLDRVVKPGNHAVLPDKDAICLEKVRRALHDAWVQPSSEEAGDAVARASITFADDGRITARRLAQGSGNATLDASVMYALNAVSRIDGLTKDFLSRHKVVTVAFKVE